MSSTSSDKVGHLLLQLGYTPESKRKKLPDPSLLTSHFIKNLKEDFVNANLSSEQAKALARRFCAQEHDHGPNPEALTHAEYLWPSSGPQGSGVPVWPQDKDKIIGLVARLIDRQRRYKLGYEKAKEAPGRKQKVQSGNQSNEGVEDDAFESKTHRQSEAFVGDKARKKTKNITLDEDDDDDDWGYFFGDLNENERHSESEYSWAGPSKRNAESVSSGPASRRKTFSGPVSAKFSGREPPSKKQKTLKQIPRSSRDEKDDDNSRVGVGKRRSDRVKKLLRPKAIYHDLTASSRHMGEHLNPARETSRTFSPGTLPLPSVASNHGLPASSPYLTGRDPLIEEDEEGGNEEEEDSATYQPIRKDGAADTVTEIDDEPGSINFPHRVSPTPPPTRNEFERPQSLAQTPKEGVFSIQPGFPPASHSSSVQICIVKYYNGIPGLSQPMSIDRLKAKGLDFWKCNNSEFFEWYHKFSGMPGSLSSLTSLVFVFYHGTLRRHWEIESSEPDRSLETLRIQIGESAAIAQQQAPLLPFEMEVTPPGWHSIAPYPITPSGSGLGRGRSL